MLSYHPALPLPNHNTLNFENLYHSLSLLDPMTLTEMVLDSYVVQFDIIFIRYAHDRYAVSVNIAKEDSTLHCLYDSPQEPLAV